MEFPRTFEPLGLRSVVFRGVCAFELATDIILSTWVIFSSVLRSQYCRCFHGQLSLDWVSRHNPSGRLYLITYLSASCAWRPFWFRKPSSLWVSCGQVVDGEVIHG